MTERSGRDAQILTGSSALARFTIGDSMTNRRGSQSREPDSSVCCPTEDLGCSGIAHGCIVLGTSSKQWNLPPLGCRAGFKRLNNGLLEPIGYASPHEWNL
ncbi:MAG: hypothetical protein IPI17_06400 [Nitrosomonas sp.]|nr:hypothetical protein [Nitrosomonas sp.]